MRKKLFAILMSAMMMVTFMPAMAFAAEEVATAKFVSKTTQYDTLEVTYAGETASFPTVREMNTTSNNKGLIEAYVTSTAVDAYLTDHQFTTAVAEAIRTEALKHERSEDTPRFYVLDGAVITGVPSEILYENRTTFFDKKTDGSYTAETAKATLKVPSYVSNYDSFKSANYSFDAGSQFYLSRTITFAVTGYDEAVKTAQNATISAMVSAATPTTSTREYLGTIASKSVLVKAKAMGQGDVEFFVDEVKGSDISTSNAITLNSVAYDGATHTIVNNTVEGVTVKYQKWNTAANAYEDIDAVTFKDIAPKAYYRAVVSKTGKTDRFVTIEITVNGKASIGVGLVGGEVYQEEVVDPYDYLVVTGLNDNSKKAVAADEAAIKALLKQVVTVTATPAKSGLTIALKAKKNTLTNEQKAAFNAAVANYNVSWDTVGTALTISPDTATLTVVPGTLENEIEFVSAPSGKTYHVKKAKSLKKAQSFTVKAEALSGKAVSYKLINANSKIKIDAATGKITLKKGLKKGTYNIKVKAYVQSGNGYKATSETQAIKIVVKK